jgi:hypothetical protein
MTGSVLYVLERDASLTGAGDERHPQRVRSDLAGAIERCSPSEPPNHLPRFRLAHALTRFRDEDRARRSARRERAPDDKAAEAVADQVNSRSGRNVCSA